MVDCLTCVIVKILVSFVDGNRLIFTETSVRICEKVAISSESIDVVFALATN